MTLLDDIEKNGWQLVDRDPDSPFLTTLLECSFNRMLCNSSVSGSTNWSGSSGLARGHSDYASTKLYGFCHPPFDIRASAHAGLCGSERG